MMKPYPKYKNSGVEWIGEIPDHWEVKKIKYEAMLKSGDGITSDSIAEKGKYPVFGGNGLRGYTCSYTHDGNYVLIGRQGALCGNINYAKGKFYASEHAVVATPVKEYSHIWFGELLRTMNLNQYSQSAAQPGISVDLVKNLYIPFPGIRNQEQIANFLNHKTHLIDTLIEKKKRLIDLLKEERTAVINEAVTKGLDPDVPMKDSGIEWLGEIPEHWDVIKIKRLSKVKRGASPRPIDNPKYFDENGEFAWVRIADVSASERYLTKTTQTLSELGASLSVKQYPGDFFLSIAGTVGKPIITQIKCCIHDGFVWFPELKVNPEYLYYIFATGLPYKGLGKWGTQLNLNTDTISDIQIPISSKQEISNIIDYLDYKTQKIDNFIEKTKNSLKLLQEYRTALISEVVTGKIDIRDWKEPEIAC